ncbi:MAG: tetratricopeptide repeat protein [Candidatus Binataceae bacterium]
MNDARREFALLVAREPIPLARGALLIAKEEYPSLDVEKYLNALIELGRQGEAIVRAGANTVERVERLSHFLFEQQGFAGNVDEFDDPRNSFLNDVIERRLGIPISLSVIYIEVGRRMGLNLHGVSFPGHFLVKAVDERGELIIDPFNQGRVLGLDDLRSRLRQIYGEEIEVQPELLQTAETRHILSRMLRNLKNIYIVSSDWTRALSALDRILILEPQSSNEILERAELYEKLECFRSALDDLQNFLSLFPDHQEADAAREGVMRLARQVALIN